GHTMAVFEDKLWLIGGNEEGGIYKNDIWRYDEELEEWTEVTDPAAGAPFSPRYAHATVVFKNKLWVIGGRLGGTDYANDVWCYDGELEEWTEVTDPATGAPFSGRYAHTTTVFDNKLWGIGGFDEDYKNDVWYSPDGITWTEITDPATGAPFPGRGSHAVAVFEDKLWLIGGYKGAQNYLGDIWVME
ncbi:MAG: hypothetical protein KDD04_06650, partial [Sinomicrobium sp.]|nr:hypothetical protein [Sinomicrobium sp.]